MWPTMASLHSACSNENVPTLPITAEEGCDLVAEFVANDHRFQMGIQHPNPYAGFSPYTGIDWLYPIDCSTPDYLPLIAERVFYHNSLIILPTKFEKSFITAVLMHNVYRWYPLGKIVYITSKRKLVEGQQRACQQFMKFNLMDVAEMNMRAKDRIYFWMAKRVFFITTQMMLTDLGKLSEILNKIKLVVIDEPQTDNTYHTKIIQKIAEHNKNFRIMCVCLTSSKSIDTSLLKEWLITNIELQWANPYGTTDKWLMNKKEISCISTPSGPTLTALLVELAAISQCYIKDLRLSKSLSNLSFENITIARIRQEREIYEQSVLAGTLRPDHYNIMQNFHLAEKMVQAYRILERDGIVALLEHHERSNDIYIQTIQKFSEFMNKLKQGIYTIPHPKFQTLDNFLCEFTQKSQHARILIVVEKLDAALIIHGNLRKFPSVSHRVLIDSDYSHYVEMFRSGTVNILIVPVEVEPAIDVGETDLIVLFSMTDQPRDFLARIARTRGATPGAIIILTTAGSEEQEINEIINTRHMHYLENRNIIPIGVDLSGLMGQTFPSLIPPGFQPKGKHIVFNDPLVQFEISNKRLSAKDVLPQAGGKRRFIDVLSDRPSMLDVVNGQMYHEVVQIDLMEVRVSAQIDEVKRENSTLLYQ
ncbi:Fanconi anemia group M protein-like [Toxorhynchites rutilus septentrionalis]|uniref:Fanconi anemia group M protein-like n=1 Tax=Toxorhynchites rutilus septentrionalis TaxID=329112 RepID=UPI00247AF112|nr:Fanconi anemia group M protein-like [Toxorhynchites rutilus septentrionalis]